eukprot:8556222-Prorocentrum_lima.AAC.1
MAPSRLQRPSRRTARRIASSGRSAESIDVRTTGIRDLRSRAVSAVPRKYPTEGGYRLPPASHRWPRQGAQWDTAWAARSRSRR